MTKKTFEVTKPNGETATFSTKRATSHAVLARPGEVYKAIRERELAEMTSLGYPAERLAEIKREIEMMDTTLWVILSTSARLDLAEKARDGFVKRGAWSEFQIVEAREL
ncbi:hypothetical protein [Roseibium aggregatum]|uniref:Uncharacterized protein n=1 Tax=Roseibium aggregatum TaxID=187304 RepID=A0A0M6Y9N4_9HYPH|nr:hypothetical protein [Roseibium aggregatum]CTQ45711.1 hypothetical protein LAL4801_04166 [Roseibium aggregatum]